MKAKIIYRQAAQVDEDTGEAMIPTKEASIIIELELLPRVGDVIDLWVPHYASPWVVHRAKVTAVCHRLHPMERQEVMVYVEVYP